MTVSDITVMLSQNPPLAMIAAFFAAVFVSLIPFLWYPFRLLFVMIHELGHVFALRLAGGKVVGYWVYTPPPSGEAVPDKNQPGDYNVSVPAGYMGLSVFSGALLLLSNQFHIAQYILGMVGGLLLLLVFLYGRQFVEPEMFDEKKTIVTAIVGYGYGISLVGTAWIADPVWSTFTISFLAVLGAITSFTMLRSLARQVKENGQDIDPELMAKLHQGNILLRNPMFWVRLWTFYSILILFGAFWFSWLRYVPFSEIIQAIANGNA